MEQEQGFIDYIEQSIIKNWDRNALTDYKGITLQYKDVARKIAKFHIVLESAGIRPGDKIAVCGRNSAHWAVAFLATVTYGAVIVPILHEFKADNIHNIVNHSEAKLLFVGDRAWENLNEEAMPLLMGIVLLTDFTPVVCRNEQLMEAFEHRNVLYGTRFPKNFRPEHISYRKEESPEELAVINYTSGTTGYSKGVMLPYRSLWSNVAYCHEMLPVRPGDHIVSMLPLGHVFGMVYDFLYGFSAGAHLYFLTRMPSPKIIAQSFSEIRPRIISCVPLIVEKIIKKDILPRIDNKIGKLLLRMPIVNDKIKADMRKKAMEVFGSNFDEIIIGGAPFNAEVERFLKQIGFPYTIAYGMTECGPIICSSRWETLKLASCGKATTRMEVKIDSPDPQNVAGEIICKGANLMLGYYKNAEATSQIIDVNGWLHTGDLATMDTEGYVTVRGRSKNMLLTASGQNIYPEEIESKLNNMPYVSESLIVLQKDKLVALIYPDFDDAFAHGMEQSDIEKVMEDNRNELNLQLPAYCQITKVKIHFEELHDLLCVDLFDRAEEGRKRTVGDLDLIADIVAHDDLSPFHAERQDFLFRQRNGFIVRRADKAGHTANVADQMPGVVRHDHLDEHVAREDLAFDFLRLARVGHFRDGLQRDLDVEDHVLQMTVGDELLDGRLDCVFIAGVSMRDIPLSIISHDCSPVSPRDRSAGALQKRPHSRRSRCRRRRRGSTAAQCRCSSQWWMRWAIRPFSVRFSFHGTTCCGPFSSFLLPCFNSLS